MNVILRFICAVVFLAGAFLGAPEPASAASQMCQVCIGDAGACPYNFAEYTTLCQQRCGAQSYAGACNDGPNNGCGSGDAIVCYEPM